MFAVFLRPQARCRPNQGCECTNPHSCFDLGTIRVPKKTVKYGMHTSYMPKTAEVNRIRKVALPYSHELDVVCVVKQYSQD